MKLEQITEAVGRTFNHAEDMIYIEGPASALKVLDRFVEIAHKPKGLTIKWDGSVAIQFGRDANGHFHFGPKYAPAELRTVQDLQTWMAARKTADQPGRAAYVEQMTNMHRIFEQSTPTAFRGYIHADLLWYGRPPIKNGSYQFEPNTVQYTVKPSSLLGEHIAQSQVGAAATQFEAVNGQPRPIKKEYAQIEVGQLVLMGPVFAVENTIELDINLLNRVRSSISSSAAAISSFAAPEKGLADMPNIIYRYVNWSTTQGTFGQNMFANFGKWVEQHSTLTKNKQAAVAAKLEQHASGARSMFEIIEGTARLKQQIIAALEGSTLEQHGIAASLVGGDEGGEGFVDSNTGLKLVDRASWTRVNSGRHQ